MKLKLEYKPYRLPFRMPVNTAHGPWLERTGALVRVSTEAGAVGYGELAPIPWFGTESLESSLAVLEGLGSTPSLAELRSLPAEGVCLRHAVGAALRRLGLRGEAVGSPEKESAASGITSPAPVIRHARRICPWLRFCRPGWRRWRG